MSGEEVKLGFEETLQEMFSTHGDLFGLKFDEEPDAPQNQRAFSVSDNRTRKKLGTFYLDAGSVRPNVTIAREKQPPAATLHMNIAKPLGGDAVLTPVEMLRMFNLSSYAFHHLISRSVRSQLESGAEPIEVPTGCLSLKQLLREITGQSLSSNREEYWRYPYFELAR